MWQKPHLLYFKYSKYFVTEKFKQIYPMLKQLKMLRMLKYFKFTNSFLNFEYNLRHLEESRFY